MEINADKLISRMSEMNSPNIKERYENIYPERLPKPQKGTDSMTNRILYYYQHDTDDGVYSFGTTKMVSYIIIDTKEEKRGNRWTGILY